MSYLSGKNVLVTGATGLVGVNLLLRLLETGTNIRATIHRKEPVILSPAIEYVSADLTEKSACIRAAEGMDFVFHCAANTQGAAVIAKSPLAHVTPNVVMNAQLLEAAYHAKVKKFIWIGSSTGYPETAARPVAEDEMMNGDPYDAYFGVGWMKRYTEVLCRLYGEKLSPSMTTIVLRATNIYGPYDDFDFETSHVLPALIRKGVERMAPFEVWGTGDDVRDLIYIDDFIEAMMLAVGKIEHYTCLNIGFGKGYSVKELLAAVLSITDYSNAEVVYNSAKPSMIPVRLVETAKAKEVMGFIAHTDVHEGIKKTVEWYRKSVGILKCEGK